ncbi:MAG: hypothetical protein OSA93_08460 [Akkermansiaceae bacterium]|nr:hypothetical protein [Akkermansiaceae bacterium]
MNRFSRIIITLFVLASAVVGSLPAMGQDQEGSISGDEIVALNTKLTEAGEAASSARKKLAIRRVIREVEALIKEHSSAPNRFEVWSILYRSQQVLIGLDNSTANRKAFLATCAKLAAAPNEYAALRLDADLLLTQAESARQGADSHARSDALRPLVERYLDTEVEGKVIRIAMVMALEFGNNKLVNDLRKVIAERLPGDAEMIKFQRDKLAGQVFGAPFVGTFELADKSVIRFPMDYLGTTTAVYFWSKNDAGLEDLKELAEAWKKVSVDPEISAPGRIRFVSMNVDDLPDAGESILREHGLDWPALRLPGGRDHQIYKSYGRHDPRVVTISPTGYAAIFMSSSRRSRGYERNLPSMLARQWAQEKHFSPLMAMFAGEFLVMDSQGEFDPAAPPEWKAITIDKLPRSSESVPEDKLGAIQACFIAPPARYATPFAELDANYKKADALCRETIASHPSAPDLWVVRNRRIIALFGLWKLNGEYQHFADAVEEAKVAVEAGYPPGTDVIARFCLARQSLRKADIDPESVIRDFVKAGGQLATGPLLAAAALLALDVADRKLHEEYRRAYLDEFADHPAMWTATNYFLDRYQRYWMYHPPFTAGWTYGRRQGYFLGAGEPEDAKRTLQLELKTVDGDTLQFPRDSEGKWTVISFVATAEDGFLSRYGSFAKERAIDNVNLLTAVLNDDAEATRKALEAKKYPDPFPTMLVPGGMQNPIVRKLGLVPEKNRPNLLFLRPDGSIALAEMNYSKGDLVQNVIECHDENAVDEALARGDLEEAKRLAFAHAPVKQVRPEDAHKHWKPKKITIPHLRSRAKIYLAMGDLKAAAADAEEVYLAVNIKAGYISMRTDKLAQIEALKATILTALKEAESK